MVGLRGFEPPTPCSRSRCATRLRYSPTVPRQIAEAKVFGNPSNRTVQSTMPDKIACLESQNGMVQFGNRSASLRFKAGLPSLENLRRVYRLASSAARIASPISVVDIGLPPSGPIRSAVRAPLARTVSMAVSSRVASSPLSKE